MPAPRPSAAMIEAAKNPEFQARVQRATAILDAIRRTDVVAAEYHTTNRCLNTIAINGTVQVRRITAIDNMDRFVFTAWENVD